MNVSAKGFFYFAVGGLAIIALAGPEPDLATMLVIILICGVLFTHAADYIAIIQGAAPAQVKKG